jgi:hypothetical protein
MSSPHDQDYGTQPCYGELVAIIAAGGLHVTAECLLSLAAARLFNGLAAIAFLAYLAWRAYRTPQVTRTWGMQLATFWQALKLQLVFGVPAMILLIGWGIHSHRFPPPRTFWLACVLYPVWGIAQQFALQNLLARNLRSLVRPAIVRALVAASLFGLAHVPRIPLVLLTLVGGFFLTLIYERRPNLWAAGCVHGVLGAMAFYFMLGQDPGARVLEFVFAHLHRLDSD